MLDELLTQQRLVNQGESNATGRGKFRLSKVSVDIRHLLKAAKEANTFQHETAMSAGEELRVYIP